MLLAFDVGNTNIVCGVYKDRKLIKNWRIATDTLQTADGYVALLGTLFHLNQLEFDDVEDIIISTVVPPIIPILETMSHRYFHVKPILVGPGIKTGLNILYDNPKELGADRIVNAVAAIAEYDCPLIIIDMGTEITLAALSHRASAFPWKLCSREHPSSRASNSSRRRTSFAAIPYPLCRQASITDLSDRLMKS